MFYFWLFFEGIAEGVGSFEARGLRLSHGDTSFT